MIKNDQISEKKIIAIQELMRSCTAAEAAEAAGVSRVTVYRWLQQKEFQAVLSERKNDLLEAAARKLAGNLDKAIDVLADLLGSKQPNVKRLTAGMIIDYSAKFNEMQDIEKRIKALEETIK